MVKRFSAVVVFVVAMIFVSFPATNTSGTLPPVWAETPSPPEQTDLININKASVEELASLKGIGDNTARAIVAYREANGHFAATEELMNVKGIGEKKYETIKDRITVGKTN